MGGGIGEASNKIEFEITCGIVCIHMSMCTHAPTHPRTHTHIDSFAHTDMHTQTHMHMYACTDENTLLYRFVFTSVLIVWDQPFLLVTFCHVRTWWLFQSTYKAPFKTVWRMDECAACPTASSLPVPLNVLVFLSLAMPSTCDTLLLEVE